MMKKRFMKTLLFILFLPLGACAPWIEAGGMYECPSHHYEVDIPEGWMQLNTDRYLLISRDGPFLQYVLIQSRLLETPFGHTRKKLNGTMLPQEAAEVIVDDMTSDPSVRGLQVLENGPTRINRHDGFRILFTYKNKEGLTLRTIYYGLIVGQWFYSLRYTAVQRYYFEKDIDTFDQIIASFKLLESKPVKSASAGS